MFIKNIKITDFKSIYGTQVFDFEKYQGLIKLSGPIGAGKTTVAEALLWGLFGTVKGQNNTQLIAWNAKDCEVEINLTSKNKLINIVRKCHEPLIITIDGKTLNASNKRDTQQILEEELFDVPKLAIVKMCIISFNAFNSLAAMNPGETKLFLDDIFGFKLFTDFNNEVVIERKTQVNESTKLNAIYEENIKQIARLREKKEEQQAQIAGSIDVENLAKQRLELVNQGKGCKEEYTKVDNEYRAKEVAKERERLVFYNKKMEYATLGKQHKEWLKKFESGVCPTCGHDISEEAIENQKKEMMQCADNYRIEEQKENVIKEEIDKIKAEHQAKLTEINNQMITLKNQIGAIDTEVSKYNDAIQLISENYDDLIEEYEEKAANVKIELDKVDIEIGQWNEMNELFTKTLRYNLLETLIPHINKSIRYFINKLDQTYKIEYDQEFKPHIYVESFSKEIAYNNLSTGQRKSLDMAIIFGILQNIIANVNFNIYFLDELFSNLDTDARNIMLSLLNETMGKDKTIFVVNHAEMNDDFFDHKIRVGLVNKKIETKKEGIVSVKASKYEEIF